MIAISNGIIPASKISIKVVDQTHIKILDNINVVVFKCKTL